MSRAGGGSDGTSAATPEDLQQVGQAFQAASNTCADIAVSRDLQSGGEFEVTVLSVPPVLGTPGNFGDAMKTVVQGFLGAMISCQMQFADAAMDLFQCAGDFRTADGVIPSGVQRMPDAAPGIATYRGGNGQLYYKDKDGDVVTIGGDGPPVPGGRHPGETYHPPSTGNS